MFADIVRTDWRYPPRMSNKDVSAPAETAPLLSRINPCLDANERAPVEFRKRYFSTSEGEVLESDFDESDEVEEEGDENQDKSEGETIEDEEVEARGSYDATASHINSQETRRKHKRQKSAKFETPDSVGPYTERRFEVLNRRKMRRLESEMEWNSGLCMFVRRRNAWTRAVSPEEAKRKTDAQDKFTLSTPEQEGAAINGQSLTLPAQEATPNVETADALNRTAESPAESAQKGKSRAREEGTPFDPPSDPSVLTNVLIPISPPILPSDHLVRANILARTDQELYDKLVKDSRTPAVPINLAHMMRIIVQGWKSEGNWPPRSSVTEDSLANRHKLQASLASAGHSAQRDGVSRVSGYFSNHPRVKQGVESFKRVLRLSSGSNNADLNRRPNDDTNRRLNDGSNKQPSDGSNKQSNDGSNRQPNDNTNRPPNEQPNDDSNRQPNDDINRELNDDTNRELNDDTNRPPNEQPNDDSNRQPNEQPKEQPGNGPNAQPSDGPNAPLEEDAKTLVASKCYRDA
jgi:hypothetical protein